MRERFMGKGKKSVCGKEMESHGTLWKVVEFHGRRRKRL